MAVKARWPTGQVQRTDTDPFADMEGAAAEWDPLAQLTKLIDEETALMNRGVTCAVREREDTSCCACPKRGTIPDLKRLCDVGARQERIVTELACKRIFDAEMPR